MQAVAVNPDLAGAVTDAGFRPTLSVTAAFGWSIGCNSGQYSIRLPIDDLVQFRLVEHAFDIRHVAASDVLPDIKKKPGATAGLFVSSSRWSWRCGLNVVRVADCRKRAHMQMGRRSLLDIDPDGFRRVVGKQHGVVRPDAVLNGAYLIFV